MELSRHAPNELYVAVRKLEGYRDEFNRQWYEYHKDMPDQLIYADQDVIANVILDVTNPVFKWPADAELSRVTGDDPMRLKYDYFLRLRAFNDDGRGWASYGADIWFNLASGMTEGYRWRLIETKKPEFKALPEAEVQAYRDYSVQSILEHEEETRKIHNLPLIEWGGLAIRNAGITPETGQAKLTVSMSDNNLMVNDRMLDVSDDAQTLHSALVLGKGEILRGLEESRERQRQLNPDAEVSLASFKVLKLPAGNMRTLRKSLTKEAINSKEQVFYSPHSLRSELSPYWKAIANSGFIPHARLFGSRSGWELGLWAQLPH